MASERLRKQPQDAETSGWDGELGPLWLRTSRLYFRYGNAVIVALEIIPL